MEDRCSSCHKVKQLRFCTVCQKEAVCESCGLTIPGTEEFVCVPGGQCHFEVKKKQWAKMGASKWQ